ncbi:MAG: hypothetical protein IJL15_03660 [Clostridia bacterium]|nr:hypothetical protein [Clostridia bacterium]
MIWKSRAADYSQAKKGRQIDYQARESSGTVQRFFWSKDRFESNLCGRFSQIEKEAPDLLEL